MLQSRRSEGKYLSLNGRLNTGSLLSDTNITWRWWKTGRVQEMRGTLVGNVPNLLYFLRTSKRFMTGKFCQKITFTKWDQVKILSRWNFIIFKYFSFITSNYSRHSILFLFWGKGEEGWKKSLNFLIHLMFPFRVVILFFIVTL